MKKLIHFLFLSVILFGCQKEDIIPDIVISDIEDNIKDTPPTINFKSENYSDINNTVGNIERQKYNFQFFTNEFLVNTVAQHFPDNKNYWPVIKASVQYDFFNDGKVDLLTFAHGDEETIPGVYILIEDIDDDYKEPVVFPSQLYAANTALLSDTNGDGKNEMILMGNNSHGYCNFKGPNNYLERIFRITFDSNKQLIEERIGNIPLAVHDGTSGDIDNDGDIDIVVFPTGTCTETPYDKLPIKLINDGFGNFTEYNLFEDENVLLEEGVETWITTSHHLFDINGDGNLDVIGGHYQGKIDSRFQDLEWNSHHKDLTMSGIFIVYGSSDGKYYYENIDYIDENVLGNSITQILYGFAFTDYDSDGDYDIILSNYIVDASISMNLDSNIYVLELIENDNNTFKNVTEERIDGYVDYSETVFSSFYRPIIHDIDDDGDYDIVATAYNYHQQLDYLTLLYWEKEGSNYIRREIQ